MAPLLYTTLRDTTLRGRDAPGAATPRLRAAWVAAQRQHLLAGCQLRDVVRALGDAGVPAVVLKGPALAEAYYRDPALRPFTDLDLLVRRRDRERALEVLATGGYEHGSPGRSLAYELEHAPAANFLPPPGSSLLPVDLHWQCVAHPGGSRATNMIADEIWSRTVPAAAWGPTARALAREDLVVYLAAHLAIHHVLTGTLWQLDLALVLARHGAGLDWEALGDRACRWRTGAAVYFALRVVHERLGAAAPEAVMRRLSPGPLQVALVDGLQRIGSDGLRQWEHVVGLAMLDHPSDVARALRTGLIPPAAWLRSRYGCHSLLAGYAVHYGRLASLVARGVKPIV